MVSLPVSRPYANHLHCKTGKKGTLPCSLPLSIRQKKGEKSHFTQTRFKKGQKKKSVPNEFSRTETSENTRRPKLDARNQKIKGWVPPPTSSFTYSPWSLPLTSIRLAAWPVHYLSLSLVPSTVSRKRNEKEMENPVMAIRHSAPSRTPSWNHSACPNFQSSSNRE